MIRGFVVCPDAILKNARSFAALKRIRASIDHVRRLHVSRTGGHCGDVRSSFVVHARRRTAFRARCESALNPVLTKKTVKTQTQTDD